MVNAKVYILQKRFEGLPKPTDFKVTTEILPSIENGQFLAQAEYLSVDPYLLMYSHGLPLGSTFIGSQIAKVIESKNPKYPVGCHVFGNFGWRTHTISDDSQPIGQKPYVIDFGTLSPSLGLGALGMTGNTAYFGLLDICQPKAGETVVVSGAAGAVGSIVGQIAKIKGCKVIGIAGTDEKVDFLVNELNFDHCLNYKTDNLSEKLKEVAPNGVDCYFDNVGGKMRNTVMEHMNKFGRISVCGAISGYVTGPEQTDSIDAFLIRKELKMEGFIVTRWQDRWMEGIKQNKKWIDEGKLKSKETITEGFENILVAFNEMMKGGNIGKAIVKV